MHVVYVHTKATNREGREYLQSRNESQRTILAALVLQTVRLSWDKRANISQTPLVTQLQIRKNVKIAHFSTSEKYRNIDNIDIFFDTSIYRFLFQYRNSLFPRWANLTFETHLMESRPQNKECDGSDANLLCGR